MHIIYRAENIIDATLVHDWLAAAEIQSFVTGAMLSGGMGELPVTGLINILVADHDRELAQQSLHQLQLARSHPLEAEDDASDLPQLCPI